MQTTVIFKADKKRKEAAQRAAKEMGIPFSAVLNACMEDFIESKEVTFTQRGIRLSHTRNVDQLFESVRNRQTP